jgi:Glycine/sarcosine/betaine reductase selenoprotein B (GRDB)
LEILKNRDQWQAEFENGWLAHYRQSGKFDWKLYTRPKNTTSIQNPGIDLSNSRLMLISSAGGYLKDYQQPFDFKNDLGDYSIRQFPLSTPLDSLAYAHDHYKHDAIDQDPQVVLPLRHLEDLHNEGLLGKLSDTVISFMGYQPDVIRVLEETIPAVIETATTEKIRSALLIPV